MYNLVTNPFTPEASFDYERFEDMVALGIIALDEILDAGLDSQPLPENKQAVIDYRAVGLGIFGLADCLVAMGIEYGSQKSIDFVGDVSSIMMTAALATSCRIAKEKGTFAKYNWEYIKESPLIKAYKGTQLYSAIEKYGLRNASLLSIAPTGSIATMVGLSGGIEPLYAISYERTTHALESTGTTFTVYAKSVGDMMDGQGIDRNNPKEVKAFLDRHSHYIKTSHDIAPENRVYVQAAMQEWVDNAISSTVNLRNDATVDDVKKVYIEAWSQGCKGLTVFRDGCARTSILGKGKPKEEKTVQRLNHITPIKRKAIGRTTGSTVAKHTACSPNLYVTVNRQDNAIFEVFTNTSTGCSSNINTITRMASLALRSGVKVDEVVKELQSNTCSACTVMKAKGTQGISVSCGAAIAEAIKEVSVDNTPEEMATVEIVEETKTACPSCGELTLNIHAKCPNCLSCGWSACG